MEETKQVVRRGGSEKSKTIKDTKDTKGKRRSTPRISDASEKSVKSAKSVESCTPSIPASEVLLTEEGFNNIRENWRERERPKVGKHFTPLISAVRTNWACFFNNPEKARIPEGVQVFYLPLKDSDDGSKKKKQGQRLFTRDLAQNIPRTCIAFIVNRDAGKFKFAYATSLEGRAWDRKRLRRCALGKLFYSAPRDLNGDQKKNSERSFNVQALMQKAQKRFDYSLKVWRQQRKQHQDSDTFSDASKVAEVDAYVDGFASDADLYDEDHANDSVKDSKSDANEDEDADAAEDGLRSVSMIFDDMIRVMVKKLVIKIITREDTQLERSKEMTRLFVLSVTRTLKRFHELKSGVRVFDSLEEKSLILGDWKSVEKFLGIRFVATPQKTHAKGTSDSTVSGQKSVGLLEHQQPSSTTATATKAVVA